MKAAFIKSPDLIKLETVHLPAPQADEVLLQVAACGLCGTDLARAAYAHKDWVGFGHEIAGTVLQAGAAAPFPPGTKVVLESASFCGACESCRNGRVDLCRNCRSLWDYPVLGFAEQMIAHVRSIVPFEELSFEVACCSEPLGVALDVVRVAEIARGQRVLVVGPGPIGLMVCALCVQQGAQVTVAGRSHSVRRLEAAGRLGARILLTDQVPWAEVPIKFERIVVTAPPQVIPELIPLASYGAVITYLGLGHGQARITFDADRFHFQKLQLRASMASPALYIPEALRLMRAGAVPMQSLISHRFRLDEIAAALATARQPRGEVVKIVIACSAPG